MVNYPQMFCPCCLAIIFLLLIHLSSYFSPIEAHNGGGFTVNLIPKNTIVPNTVQSPVSSYKFEYLMELEIGTPPVKYYGNADTGSDLVWIQCVPCNKCYKQLNPLFDPHKSSTYTPISCHSKLCDKVDTQFRGCSHHKLCNYTYEFGDSSMIHGVLARETIALTSTTGEPVFLKGIIFGCGHNDTGVFNDHVMGLIGLGGGPLSLVSQIGSSLGGKMYFSQCLVPFGTDIRISSRMSFGKGSEVLGDSVVSTPLVVKKEFKTGRLVTLLGISVEDIYLPFNSSRPIEKGNVMLDSGTAITYLPKKMYEGLVDQVRKRVPMKPISNSTDVEVGNGLCYQTKTNVKGPTLTVHFEGANVLLTHTQVFFQLKDDISCLGFIDGNPYDGLYGNFAQSNYLIGFDLDRQVVSFKPTDCTKY